MMLVQLWLSRAGDPVSRQDTEKQFAFLAKHRSVRMLNFTYIELQLFAHLKLGFQEGPA